MGQVARGGNEYIPSQHEIGTPEDCDATVRQIRRSGAAAVIVAAPGISTEYLRELSSTGALIAVIDSEAAVRFPSKLVFNPLLGPTLKQYAFEGGTRPGIGRPDGIVGPVFRRQ